MEPRREHLLELLDQGHRWDQLLDPGASLGAFARSTRGQLLAHGASLGAIARSTRGLSAAAQVTLALALSLVLAPALALAHEQVRQGQQEQVRQGQQQGARSLHPRVVGLVPEQPATGAICDATGVLCPTHGGVPDAWQWHILYGAVPPYLPRRHLPHARCR